MRRRASAIGATLFAIALTVGLATSAWGQAGPAPRSVAQAPVAIPSGFPTANKPPHINPSFVRPSLIKPPVITPTRILPTRINPTLIGPIHTGTATPTTAGTPSAPPTPTPTPTTTTTATPTPTPTTAPTATQGAPQPQPTPTNAAVPPGTATVVSLGTENGKRVLVDQNNHTLYAFSADQPGVSACDGACATTWPPLVGPATVGSGVDATNLGTLTRADGTMQVTYFGKPLYDFAGDQKPGDANGAGIGNAWYPVDSQGADVK